MRRPSARTGVPQLVRHNLITGLVAVVAVAADTVGFYGIGYYVWNSRYILLEC